MNMIKATGMLGVVLGGGLFAAQAMAMPGDSERSQARDSAQQEQSQEQSRQQASERGGVRQMAHPEKPVTAGSATRDADLFYELYERT